MPPIPADKLQKWLCDIIERSPIVIFSKTTCPFCAKVKKLFDENSLRYLAVEINEMEDCQKIQDILFEKTTQRTVPNVFVRGTHIGGCDDTFKALEEGKIKKLLQEKMEYEYDLIVIGGGSGGLAASKEASRLGAKVAIFDFVKPTPMGTTWGLGGTCVNVGCIPKKLMHQSAIIKHSLEDAIPFGWKVSENVTHDWNEMVTGIQNYIKSLNWGYRVALRKKEVSYINAYAKFIDKHKVMAIDSYGKEREYTANHFIIATGERPRYPDEVPGAREYTITSDDLFSLSYCPGKTLVIGASYVALECAGFLAGLGLRVTVMVRSIFLRGFDQQMANMIADYMEKHENIEFIRGCVPIKVIPMEEGCPGKKEVVGKFVDTNKEHKDWYNTVIFAIGRDPCTTELGLETIGVELNKSNRVIVNKEEQTNIDNVYAIGDIIAGGIQLTPVAIQAGKYLARRLYGGSTKLIDYTNVATTVFTPLEYGSIGLSEEDAKDKFGTDKIEVFHQNFKPLEWTVAHRPDNACYAKLICNKGDEMRIVGLHVLGPNAGEITQGYALGMRLGATKEDFDDTIGIHPTCTEVFTTMEVTKSSGVDPAQSGC